MHVRETITIVLFSAGLIAIAASVFGTYRMQDFFCRLHSAGIGAGMGVLLCCLGLMVYKGLSLTSLKIAFAAFMLLVTGPVGTHMIAKAAFHAMTLDVPEVLEAESPPTETELNLDPDERSRKYYTHPQKGADGKEGEGDFAEAEAAEASEVPEVSEEEKEKKEKGDDR